jgi:hypothetical protein
VSTPTLRRLDDRERYWGLTWPGWLALLAGSAGLYLAVRLSPLGTKPTITLALIVLTFVGMVLHGVSGQALSPGRQLFAIVNYRRSPKLLELTDRMERRGLVLDAIPPAGNLQEVEVDRAWVDHRAWEDSCSTDGHGRDDGVAGEGERLAQDTAGGGELEPDGLGDL